MIAPVLASLGLIQPLRGVPLANEDMHAGLAPLSARRWLTRTAGDAVAHVETKGKRKGTRRERRARKAGAS